MAVFFDELAVERLFRVVERSSVAFLPVCPHEGDVRRECPQLFRYTNHGRNGSECHVNGQEDAGPRASGAESVQEEKGEEGVKHGGGLEQKFVVHHARPEKEAACHSLPE